MIAKTYIEKKKLIEDFLEIGREYTIFYFNRITIETKRLDCSMLPLNTSLDKDIIYIINSPIFIISEYESELDEYTSTNNLPSVDFTNDSNNDNNPVKCFGNIPLIAKTQEEKAGIFDFIIANYDLINYFIAVDTTAIQNDSSGAVNLSTSSIHSIYDMTYRIDEVIFIRHR